MILQDFSIFTFLPKDLNTLDFYPKIAGSKNHSFIKNLKILFK